ncbi:hypothetical protein TrCOL_g10011 [Triparma columacea]|uniref:Uncharacterized protein n=1 Tax=Triparma columacea TaxID=722753 RepID=A0A9W7GDM2_9STRA|nr:hypothetical protein TrCOL_g10011 [Triparma columacea]
MFKEWYSDLGPGERVRPDVVRSYRVSTITLGARGLDRLGGGRGHEAREEVEGVLGGRRGKKEETIRKEVLEARNGMIREF